MTKQIHVVAAVIVDGRGRYLVAERAAHKHQGGCWEFPGGKVEPGETEVQALSRELMEEIGLTPTQQRPLLQVSHDYGDRRILLSAWLVTEFLPGPCLSQSEQTPLLGLEGQPLQWVMADCLPTLNFPAANRPILAAALLPQVLRISPELDSLQSWLDWLQQRVVLATDRDAIVLRQPALNDEQYMHWAESGLSICQQAGMPLFVHGSVSRLQRLPQAAGLHLPFAEAGCLPLQRPISRDHVLLVACHNAQELALAQQLDADCALLSPVLATSSHPEQQGMGWAQWAALVAAVNIPVYALGGMTSAHLAEAWQQGGQGVAGISGF